MTTECRFCSGLECEPDYHEASANIHAYLRSLVNRNWVKDMAKAKAEAKKLWKVRHEKPNYRVDIRTRQAEGARAGARRGGRANRKTHPEA